MGYMILGKIYTKREAMHLNQKCLNELHFLNIKLNASKSPSLKIQITERRMKFLMWRFHYIMQDG